MKIQVVKNILDANDRIADENRALFDIKKIFVMNLMSSPGADKPSKYPLIFQKSSVMLLNKIDLLPYLDFNREKVLRDVRALNRDIAVFEVSCRTAEGLDGWYGWLQERIDGRGRQRPAGDKG